jgi:hypothetical protein
MLTVRERIGDGATATMPGIGVSWVELMTTIPQLMPSGVLPVYRPSEIVYGGKCYILREPLECAVSWEGDDTYYYAIRYRPFELNAMGLTFSEAVFRFGFKFADKYEWLNAVHKDPVSHGVRGLGDRLEDIRLLMNASIVSVKEL